MTSGDSQKKDFTLSRAKAAVLSRDFDLAARLYKNLLKTEPDNQEILHELAAMYARSGQDYKALAVYEQILEKNKDDFNALTSLGGIYRRLNRFDDSIEVLDKALALDPDNIQVHYNLGFTYKLMGMYQDALECFNIVIGENPNDILAYNQQGSIHSLMGDSKSAISSYRRGLQLDQNHPVLHLNLAKELEKLGREEEVKSEYEAALRAKPGWSDALNGYALFLMDRDKNAEAYELLQRGIKVSPDDIVLQNSMGALQLRRGEYEDAEALFNSVLSRNFRDQDALMGLADVYSKENNPQKVASVVDRIKKQPPKTEEDQVRYAKALLSAKRMDEGETLIKQLWHSNNSSLKVMNLVAEYYACCNDIPKLKSMLKRMSDSDSEYCNHYLDIAERFKQNGNIKESQVYLEQYLEHRPNDTSALSALASCYEMLQKYSEALSLYRKALAKDRNNNFLKAAVKRTGTATGVDVNRTNVLFDVPAEDPMAQATHADDVSDGVVDAQDYTSNENLDFSDEGEISLGSDTMFEDFPSVQKEIESEEEDEMIFNLDGIDSSFSNNEDVYDPLELEPMELELEEEEVPTLEALTFDGAPVDYEPSEKKMDFDEDQDTSMPQGLSFEDEELELAEDIAEQPKEVESSSPEPLQPEPPKYPPQYPPYPSWMPPPVQKKPEPEPATPPSFVPEEPQFEEPPEPDLQGFSDNGDTELPLDSEQGYEDLLPLDDEVQDETLGNKAMEVLSELVDKDLAMRCDSAAGLFKHIRSMCDYLPPLQKEAFIAGKKHVQIDYIIERLSGRPGLLATAEEMRRKGLVDIPCERYDIVEKFDDVGVTGRVFSFMRGMIHQLPDKDVAQSLDGAVTDILEKLALKNSL